LFYVISSLHAKKRKKKKQNNYYFYIKKEIGTKFVLCAKIFLSPYQNNKKTKKNIFAHYIAKNTPKGKKKNLNFILKKGRWGLEKDSMDHNFEFCCRFTRPCIISYLKKTLKNVLNVFITLLEVGVEALSLILVPIF